MALIEDAKLEFTEKQAQIHNLIKDFDENDVMDYAIKRSAYEQVTAEEIDHINDIYEQGTTTFEIKIPTLQKTHKLRILSQKEKAMISKMADKKFNSPEAKKEYFSDEIKYSAITEFKVIATLAYALLEVNGDRFDIDVSKRARKQPNDLTIEDKIEYCELLPAPIISTLYNRYIDFEGRLFSVFQYESVRKK